MSGALSRTARGRGPTWLSALALTGLWFALAGGALEDVALLVKSAVFGQIINRSPFYVWMTPASYLLLMGTAAVLLLAAGAVVPRLRHPAAAAFTFGGVAVTSVLVVVLLKRIYTWSLLLLALGVAVQLARSVGARPDAFRRLVRRSTPWLAGAVVVLGGSVHGWHAWREHRAVASLPAAGAGAPNLLLIILDTVRWANVGLSGYARPTTPSLDALAARGVTFERAFSPAPWTLPAHASMFTGHLPAELSANWNTPLDDTYPTVAEVLARAGYRTAGFVANRDYATYEHGLARGFQHYEDYRITPGEIVLSSGLGHWLAELPGLRVWLGTDDRLALKRAATVADEFLAWVGTGHGHPFFAFLNMYDAHEPYLPPEPWFHRFAVQRHNRLSAFLRSNGKVPDRAEVDDEMAAYDGAIAYMDSQVGRILHQLDARGLAEHTMVIVASDHGEEFGEHGLLGHGHSLFATQLWVPLVMAGPAPLPHDVKVWAPVTLRDVGATLASLGGVSPGAAPPGAPLTRWWGDSAPAPSPIVSQTGKLPEAGAALPAGKGSMESLVRWPLHMISRSDGRRQFFNLARDPYELVDLREIWFSGPPGDP